MSSSTVPSVAHPVLGTADAAAGAPIVTGAAPAGDVAASVAATAASRASATTGRRGMGVLLGEGQRPTTPRPSVDGGRVELTPAGGRRAVGARPGGSRGRRWTPAP